MKHFSQKLFAVALTLCCEVTSLAAAPSLVVSNNKLVGANGVSVDGKLYDVSFADGNCLGLFGGCTNGSFAFQTYALAHAASVTLSQDVFKDVAAGNFDTSPELTAGCSLGIGCIVLTPYNTINGLVYYSYVDNGSGSTVSYESHEGFSVTNSYNTNSWADKTFAIWSVSAVPEPQAYAVLLAGLGLMGLVARRRSKKRI